MQYLFYITLIISISIAFQLNFNFFRKKSIKIRADPHEKNFLYDKSYKLVATTFKKNTESATKFFLVTSLLLFIITLSNTRNLHIVQSIIISSILAYTPFLLLTLRLRFLRLSVSNEAENIIIEIVNQYKVNHFNMLEALTKTISTQNNSKQTKRLLTVLVAQLNEYSNEKELVKILDDFVYSINTEWSKMLANNIYFAIENNLNVLTSLEDIVKELKIARSTFEKEKRSNLEGYMIGQYLIPILYVGSVIVSIQYFDFTFEKFMDYQLNTESGLRYFTMIIGLSAINTVGIFSQKNKKFDF